MKRSSPDHAGNSPKDDWFTGQQALCILWLTFIIVPLLALIVRPDRFLPLLTVFLAGSGILLLALRSDPRGERVAGLQLPGKIRGTFCLCLLVFQVSAFLLGGGFFWVWELSIVLLLALWLVSTEERTFGDLFPSAAVAAAAIVLLCAGCEIFFRSSFARELFPSLNQIDRGWATHFYSQPDDITPVSFGGIRSLHFARAKSRSIFRIVTLGDSFTWGDKVADTNELWPYVIENSERSRGAALEVINLGVRSFTTANEEELLRKFGWSYQPDLVLLQFLFNDALPSGPDFAFAMEESLYPQWPLVPILNEDLERISHAYHFFNSRFREAQTMLFRPQDGRVRPYRRLYHDGALGWEQSRTALARISEEAARRNVPVLVILFPILDGRLDDAGYPYRDLEGKIETAARDAALPFFNLRPALAAEPPPGGTWCAFSWDCHPSSAAHAAAGRAILSELKARELIAQ